MTNSILISKKVQAMIMVRKKVKKVKRKFSGKRYIDNLKN